MIRNQVDVETAERNRPDAPGGEIEVLLDALGVASLAELRRLVTVACELESGVDRLSGSRYAQMTAVANAGPIISVLVVADDVELGERDEETAASFARLAVRKANRDRSVS